MNCIMTNKPNTHSDFYMTRQITSEVPKNKMSSSLSEEEFHRMQVVYRSLLMLGVIYSGMLRNIFKATPGNWLLILKFRIRSPNLA